MLHISAKFLDISICEEVWFSFNLGSYMYVLAVCLGTIVLDRINMKPLPGSLALSFYKNKETELLPFLFSMAQRCSFWWPSEDYQCQRTQGNSSNSITIFPVLSLAENFRLHKLTLASVYHRLLLYITRLSDAQNTSEDPSQQLVSRKFGVHTFPCSITWTNDVQRGLNRSALLLSCINLYRK